MEVRGLGELGWPRACQKSRGLRPQNLVSTDGRDVHVGETCSIQHTDCLEMSIDVALMLVMYAPSGPLVVLVR